MAIPYGAQGFSTTLRGNATVIRSLAAGASFVIPAGNWNVRLGPYSTVQEFDPVLQIFRPHGDDGVTWGSIGGGTFRQVQSDGQNWRIANLTGCAVGALITTAGSAMTNGIGTTATGVTVTPSAGSSVWSPIVGGALNTSPTITNGGTNYDYAPILTVQAPPAGGIPATMTCTVSAGVINAVTVTNQGAGYTSAPLVTVTRDPRDDSGAGGVITNALTGSGTLTGLLCTNQGTALTSVPTLTFSSGGSAATVIMCFTLLTYVVVTAGTSYIDAPILTGVGGFPATAAVLVNPATQRNLLRERKASIRMALSATTITATGQVVDDGGIYAGIPTALVLANQNTGLTPSGITFTVGGASDSFELYPA
jgi:hypothetical protein